MKIEICPIEAKREFTIRERLGIRILCVLFYLIFPARYSHQVDELMKEIKAV